MVAVTEKKTHQKALLITSGPAMLEKMVRPLKDAGLGVNACENFIDAKNLFASQALVVLPIKDDEQDEAKAFVEWLRRQAKPTPYVLGVGRCEAGLRKGLVAKMGLNDLITLPFDEVVVRERLASFHHWSRPLPGEDAGQRKPESDLATALQHPEKQIPPDLLHTTRVSLFADSSDPEDEESPETIYCREAPVGIAMFDRELRYVLANPRWIQQFRLKNEEILGRSQFEVFPKLHPNWRKIYQRCLNGETRRGRESVDSGHGPLEMRWEVRPWRYRAGQIGGVTIAFEEVWRPTDGGPPEAPAAKPDTSGLSIPASHLDAPALLLDLEGAVVEKSEAAKALGIWQAEAPFVAALRRGIDALPLTDLVCHEDPATQIAGRMAWSNTVLRNGSGEPSGVLRVGVFLPESLLTVDEPDQRAPSDSRPTTAANSALQLLPESDAASGPPTVESFEDEDLDALAELVWKANTRGEITYFNAAWLAFRNRPLERELNGGWIDGLHLADARATKAVVAEAIREQTALEHIFRLKDADGQFVKMKMWVRPYHDPNENLLGFYGACRALPDEAGAAARSLLRSERAPDRGDEWPRSKDDTHRNLILKLAEAEQEIAALREVVDAPPEIAAPDPAEESPGAVFHSAPVMLWASDIEGRLIACNEEWRRQRGRSEEEELLDGWLDGILKESERVAVREQLRLAAMRGTPLECRFHWLDADGHSRLVEMQGAPRFDPTQHCEGLSGSVRDVTEECAVLARLRDLIAPPTAGADGVSGVAELVDQLGEKLPTWSQQQSLAQSDLTAFREIFDHVAAGIVLLGPDTKPLFANQRHRELLGFGIEEAGDMEGWLSRACDDPDHARTVLKIWQEDIWRRQLTKVIALKTRKGNLREIKIEPQLFLDNNRLLLTIHDVTESQRSEEAMRDSEIRFRALFRESSMGIALIDGEEKIYDINPALERVLGIPRRQLLCRHFDECVHPGDLPRKQSLLQELLHSPKRSAQIELRLASPKGDESADEAIWVRLHISLVRDVDQRVLFTAYFVQDITEQKQVQAELLISQEQNRALLEVIPELILLVDRQGQVIDLMPGESVPIDIPEADAIGNRIDQVLEAFAGQFETLIKQAYLIDDVVQYQFSGKEGGEFEARIVACKPDNAVITIQRAAEEPSEATTPVAEPASPEIPESTRLQSLSFQSAPDAVILTNFKGAILDWNPAAETLFGYSKQEAHGQPFPALFGVDSLDALTRHLKPADGHRWAGEIPYKHKDRTDGTALLNILPLKGETGEVAGQVAFIRKVEAAPPTPTPTPAKAAEEPSAGSLAEQLPQVHKRLRNNLQIIATLLNLQFKSQSDDTARRALLTSRNRAQTLLLLHEQIEVHQGRESIDFGKFARSLADQLLETYEATDRVRVSIEINEILDLQSASPLSLILSELLSNAIRHGFPDPATGLIHLSMTLQGEKGQLTVSDNGIGLAEATPNSSGMGLQIVKTLASQIRGNLEKIDSTETEFRVYFTTSLRQ